MNRRVKHVASSDLLIPFTCRQFEVMILNSNGVQASLGRLAGEMQSQSGSISLRSFEFSTVTRIVHLEHQHRTCGNLLRGTSRKYIDSFTRRIPGKEQSECITTFRRSGTLEGRSAVWSAATVINHRSISLHLQQRAIAIKHVALHQRASAALALLELLNHLWSLNESNYVVNNF